MLRFHRVTTTLGLVLMFAWGSLPAMASEETSEYQIHDVVHLHKDKTYSDVTTFDRTVLRVTDIDNAGQFSTTFDPHNQTYKLLSAWVLQPDGRKIDVPASSVLIRPSAAAQDAPGFVSTKTATILFPQVKIGSKVHAEVKVTTFKAYKLGYSDAFSAGIFHNGDVYVTLYAPASLPLSVGAQNGFQYTNKIEGDRRVIKGQYHMRGASPSLYENHMPNPLDLSPLLSVSTITSYLELAKDYYHLSADKADVTPEIQALANHITQGKQGKAAARALYDWVTKNIRYVAMYLTANSSWIPHSANQVLENGYGDCKDHVVLLQALLTAKGIKSDPAIINWSNRNVNWPAPSVEAFNHMIIYLPAFHLYANPTDQSASFGVLDYGLSNKQVLLVGKHPKLTRTPKVIPREARFVTNGDIKISRDGTIKGKAYVSMSPILASYLRYQLSNKENRQDALKQALSLLPHYGFGHIKTTDPHNLDVPFSFSMDWISRKALHVGTRAFVLPDMPNFAPQDPPQQYLREDAVRRYPVMLQPKDLHWHFTLTPPKGYRFDDLPPNVNVHNSVGDFVASYRLKGHSMVVDRELILKVRQVPAKHYDSVESIARAVIDDEQSIVSLKKR